MLIAFTLLFIVAPDVNILRYVSPDNAPPAVFMSGEPPFRTHRSGEFSC